MQAQETRTGSPAATPVTIKTYGHASIYIKTPTVSLITDPWFSETGAFLSSWFQFPDNTQLDLAPVRDVDYVFLSHEHQDHFDYRFLQTLSPKTKIVIPKYADSYLRDELAEHVRNEVMVVANRKKTQISPDVTFTPVVQSVPIWDDCTLIFETPAGTIVDVNDMKINNDDLEWVKSAFRVNHLFVQFSGANWHPFVYDYPNEKKRQIAQHKILNKFRNVKHLFQNTNADWLVPFAGPPAFLDPDHFAANFGAETIFPTVAEFYRFAQAEGFGDRTVVLNPGDAYAPREGLVAAENERRLQHEAYTDRERYLKAYQARRLEVIRREVAAIPPATESLLKKAKTYFEPLISSSPFFREKINGALLLDVTGEFAERILVDFTKPEDQVKPYAGEPVFYTFTIEDRLLNRILDRKLAWEELFLSLRFRASRNPDNYNEHLIVFLRFANAVSYKLFERYEKRKESLKETFLLEHGGKTYEVQRYCPHAMGDLSQGAIVDGCVVCPLHGWVFSLEDGSCQQNNSRIRVTETRRAG